jgi:hypothetical protein
VQPDCSFSVHSLETQAPLIRKIRVLGEMLHGLLRPSELLRELSQCPLLVSVAVGCSLAWESHAPRLECSHVCM